MTVAVCFGVVALTLPTAIACAVMSYNFAAKRTDGYGVLTGCMAVAFTGMTVLALGKAIAESTSSIDQAEADAEKTSIHHHPGEPQ